MREAETQQLGIKETQKVAGNDTLFQRKPSMTQNKITQKKKEAETSKKSKNKGKLTDRAVDKAQQIEMQNQRLYSAVYDQLKNQSLNVTQQYLSMLVKRKGVDQQWDKKIDLGRLSKLFVQDNLPNNQSEKGKKAVAQAYWGTEQDLLSREQAMEMLFACQFNLGVDWNEIKDLINELQQKRQERLRKQLQQAERRQAQEQEQRRIMRQEMQRNMQINDQEDGNTDFINLKSDKLRDSTIEQALDNEYSQKQGKNTNAQSKTVSNQTKSLFSGKFKGPQFNSTGGIKKINSIKKLRRKKLTRQKTFTSGWRLKQRLINTFSNDSMNKGLQFSGTIHQQSENRTRYRRFIDNQQSNKSQILLSRLGDRSLEHSFASPNIIFRQEGLSGKNSASKGMSHTRDGSIDKMNSKKSYNALGMSRVLSLTTYQFPMLPEYDTLTVQKSKKSTGVVNMNIHRSKSMRNQKLFLNINLNPDFESLHDDSMGSQITEQEKDILVGDDDNDDDDIQNRDYEQLQKLISKQSLRDKDLRKIIRIKNLDMSVSFQNSKIMSKGKNKYLQIQDSNRAKPDVLQPGELQSDFDFQKRWNEEQNKTKKHMSTKRSFLKKNTGELSNDQIKQDQNQFDQQDEQAYKKNLRDLLLKKMKTPAQQTITQKQNSAKKKVTIKSPQAQMLQITYFAKRKWARRARQDVIAYQIKGFMKTHSVSVKQISKLLSHLYPKQKVIRLMRAMGISFQEISQLTNTQQKRYNDIHSKLMWLTLINKPLVDPKDKVMLRLMKELGHTTNIQKELDVRFTNNVITTSSAMDQLLNPKPILDVSRVLGGSLNNQNRFYDEYHPKPNNFIEEQQRFINQETDLKRACIRLANVIRQVQTYQRIRKDTLSYASFFSNERPFSNNEYEQKQTLDGKKIQAVDPYLLQKKKNMQDKDSKSGKFTNPDNKYDMKNFNSQMSTVKSKQLIDLYLPRTAHRKIPSMEDSQSSMMQTQLSFMLKTDGNNSVDRKISQLGRLLTPSSDLNNFNKTQNLFQIDRGQKVIEEKNIFPKQTQVILEQKQKEIASNEKNIEIEKQTKLSRVPHMQQPKINAMHRRELSLQQQLPKSPQNIYIGSHYYNLRSKTVANLLQSAKTTSYDQAFPSKRHLIPKQQTKDSFNDNLLQSALSSNKMQQNSITPKRSGIFMRGSTSLKQLSGSESKSSTKHYQNALSNINNRPISKLQINDFIPIKKDSIDGKPNTTIQSPLLSPHSDIEVISNQLINSQNVYMQPIFGTTLPTRVGLRSKQNQSRKPSAIPRIRTNSAGLDKLVSSQYSMKSPIQRGSLHSQSPLLQAILPSMIGKNISSPQNQKQRRFFPANQNQYKTMSQVVSSKQQDITGIHIIQQIKESQKKSQIIENQNVKEKKSSGKLLAEKLRKLAPITLKQKHNQTSQDHLKSALFLSQNMHHLKILNSNKKYQETFTSKRGSFQSPAIASQTNLYQTTEREGQKESFSCQIPTNTQSAGGGGGEYQDSKINSQQKMIQSINKSVQSQLLQYQKALYFEHYINIFGNPSMPIEKLKLQRCPLKLSPKQVFVMAMRLGISLTKQMPQYDLIWIAQQAIVMDLPEMFLRSQNKIANDYLGLTNDVHRYEFLSSIPPNQHPGDAYFQKLLKFQRKQRKNQIKQLKDAIMNGQNIPGTLKRKFQPQQRVILRQRSQGLVKKDVISQIFEYLQLRSWLEFRQTDNQQYFYNFILKQKKDKFLEKYPPHLSHLQKLEKPVLDTLKSIFPALQISIGSSPRNQPSSQNYIPLTQRLSQQNDKASNHLRSAMTPSNNFYSTLNNFKSIKQSSNSYFKNRRESAPPNTNIHILLQTKKLQKKGRGQIFSKLK